MNFRVATFNAGLAVGVLPFATERVPRVVEALSDLNVDLLFVQEFWLDSHWQALCDALRPKLPHAFRPEPAQKAALGACTTEQVQPLVDCAETHCAGLKDEALARCVVSRCARSALSLPPPCLNCIASHPVGALHDIVSRCIGDSPVGADSSALASGYGGLVAYGGSFGTGLLARTALARTDRLVFESTVNARGAVYAQVVAPGIGLLHVFAAHLSPGGAEQPPQAERLVRWVLEKAPRGPALLLGDLNATPRSAVFERFVRAGFRPPNAEDQRATFAPDGLGSGTVAESGWRLDHVLGRELGGELRTERILDSPVTLEVQGRHIRSTLSDHFGVLGTWSPSER
jgi:endonuclease/exonuclease/phosphatase family metal-dependent hydrolase